MTNPPKKAKQKKPEKTEEDKRFDDALIRLLETKPQPRIKEKK
jgi:hypothetical protein